MDLVGKDKGLDMRFPLLSQALDKVNCLDEIDVPVVIAVDEEDRRTPKTDICHRRGIKGQAYDFIALDAPISAVRESSF